MGECAEKPFRSSLYPQEGRAGFSADQEASGARSAAKSALRETFRVPATL